MVGWASGPGLPKKERGGEGLISENRAPGAYASYFFSVHEHMHPGHVFWAVTDTNKLT